MKNSRSARSVGDRCVRYPGIEESDAEAEGSEETSAAAIRDAICAEHGP